MIIVIIISSVCPYSEMRSMTWKLPYRCEYDDKEQGQGRAIESHPVNVQECISTLLGVILGITSFGVEIHSQKSDSNHYFGVDSTIIWEWIQLQMKWITDP